ncbi:FadR/GntR family transcriptional regulator [uncultured Devosia sp.]|uniref:FadR/GntR family transcriptional regulator n=1 Tax=uncultured Devosia sp. TaxID=211434 RepID=UPI0035CC69C6
MTSDEPPAVPILGRVASRNFHNKVIWTLGVNIVGGLYAEGATLPNDAQLQREQGVSRTVVREALKTLAAKGLIEARTRIGTRVRPRQHWNLFDADVLAWHFDAGADLAFLGSLAEMRLAIEPEAAAHAALRRTNEQASTLVERAGHMADPANTAEAFARADLEFHRAVADASGNPFMRSISALVELALMASFKLSSPVADRAAFDRSVAVHGAIAAAIRDGDAQAARAAMRQAIEDGYSRTKGTFI